MGRNANKGFTLIELMIVVLIIGILAAIAIPNFLAMQNKAKEGSVKSNMHTFQLAAEDYSTSHDGFYPQTATVAAAGLPSVFKNPWTQLSGSGNSWVNGAPAAKGVVGYTATDSTAYEIQGYGSSALLTLTLNNGQ